MHDPRVPETLEGWSLLHQRFRVRWNAWRELSAADRARLSGEAAAALGSSSGDDRGATSLTTILGHKADLMLTHFRRGFEELQAAQLAEQIRKVR